MTTPGQVHVGEEFGVRDNPTAPGFDATVVLFYRLVEVVGNIGKFVLSLQCEHGLDSFMQLRLILFERQNIVAAFLCDLVRNRFLTGRSHRLTQCNQISPTSPEVQELP